MRLGQLARKLEVKPSDIVSYLATKNIRIEENTNTKLDTEVVTQVLSHFAPHLNVAQVPTKEVSITDAPDVIQDATVSVPEEVAPLSSPLASVLEDTPEETEVIKAPKIELSGLKV